MNDMTEQKHTPTPWSGGYYSDVVGVPIVGPSGEVVGNTAKLIFPKDHPNYQLIKERGESNAQHIIKCVNAHDDLVRQLSDAIIDLEALATLATQGMIGKWTLGMFRRLSAHKEALAKAKGGA